MFLPIGLVGIAVLRRAITRVFDSGNTRCGYDRFKQLYEVSRAEPRARIEPSSSGHGGDPQ